MAWFGLLLLALALLAMSTTGWPSYAILLGLATLGATLGWWQGSLTPALLGSLAPRLVGLLENDLLQALVLYALVGALLQHLGLAVALHRALQRLLRPAAAQAASGCATLLLGALLAPLNGSVGASLHALRQATQPEASAGAEVSTRATGAASTAATALTALAATLGVVIPPSLVLLLLGDALLRAHTEGLNLARDLALPLAGQDIRVVNTQDLLQAALLPGALVLLGSLLLTLLLARRPRCEADAAGPASGAALEHGPATVPAQPATSVDWGWPSLLALVLGIVALLVLVTTGRVRAVEGAAAAGVAVLLWAALARRLTRAQWWQVLDDALALSGALFALLVAATTFSLVLRALGSDALVTQAMLALQGHPQLALAAVMAALLAASFVLDAFELIFLVIPIVMPPLLAQVADAAWVGCLSLLVLQAGFLLPPSGYALVMARATMSGPDGRPPSLAALSRLLWPYLAWSACVVALLLVWPAPTQWLRTAPVTVRTGPGLEGDALERALREMAPQR